VKHEYKAIFRDSDEITLSPRALAFMVSELSKYEFSRIDVDCRACWTPPAHYRVAALMEPLDAHLELFQIFVACS
jgi:hypothetical protein